MLINITAKGRKIVATPPAWSANLFGVSKAVAVHPGDLVSSTLRQQWADIAQHAMDVAWTFLNGLSGTYPLLGGNAPQDAGHGQYYDGYLNHLMYAVMAGEGPSGTYKLRGEAIMGQYVTYVFGTTPGIHQMFPESLYAFYLQTGDSRIPTIMGRFKNNWNGNSANQYPDALRALGGLSYGNSYGAVTANGVNALGATTISVHKVTNASSVTAGDVINIASGPAAGSYTVTANATLIVGNTNVSITPGLLGATAGGEVITRPSYLFTEGRIVGRYILEALCLHKSGIDTGTQHVASGAYVRNYASPLAVAQDYALAAIEKQKARGDWDMGSTMHNAQYNFHAAIMCDAMWKLYLYAPDPAILACLQKFADYLKTLMFNTGWPYNPGAIQYGQGIVDYSLDSTNNPFTVPFSSVPVGSGGVGMNVDLGNLFAPLFFRLGDPTFAERVLGTTSPNAYATSQARYGHMGAMMGPGGPYTTGSLQACKATNEFMLGAGEYLPRS